MSARFQRWVKEWMEEHIQPGGNTDIETNETKAARLTEQVFAEAAAAGFSKFEIDGERKRVTAMIATTVADARDFDVDAYHLKSQLAQENEDGD